MTQTEAGKLNQEQICLLKPTSTHHLIDGRPIYFIALDDGWLAHFMADEKFYSNIGRSSWELQKQAEDTIKEYESDN